VYAPKASAASGLAYFADASVPVQTNPNEQASGTYTIGSDFPDLASEDAAIWNDPNIVNPILPNKALFSIFSIVQSVNLTISTGSVASALIDLTPDFARTVVSIPTVAGDFDQSTSEAARGSQSLSARRLEISGAKLTVCHHGPKTVSNQLLRYRSRVSRRQVATDLGGRAVMRWFLDTGVLMRVPGGDTAETDTVENDTQQVIQIPGSALRSLFRTGSATFTATADVSVHPTQGGESFVPLGIGSQVVEVTLALS
jgi:hypothetical protein